MAELKKKKDPLAKLALPQLPKLPKQKQMIRENNLATRKKNSKNRTGK
jgi:hypothetical protein